MRTNPYLGCLQHRSTRRSRQAAAGGNILIRRRGGSGRWGRAFIVTRLAGSSGACLGALGLGGLRLVLILVLVVGVLWVTFGGVFPGGSTSREWHHASASRDQPSTSRNQTGRLKGRRVHTLEVPVRRGVGAEGKSHECDCVLHLGRWWMGKEGWGGVGKEWEGKEWSKRNQSLGNGG